VCDLATNVNDCTANCRGIRHLQIDQAVTVNNMAVVTVNNTANARAMELEDVAAVVDTPQKHCCKVKVEAGSGSTCLRICLRLRTAAYGGDYKFLEPCFLVGFFFLLFSFRR
jgi:hypothetical protein